MPRLDRSLGRPALGLTSPEARSQVTQRCLYESSRKAGAQAGPSKGSGKPSGVRKAEGREAEWEARALQSLRSSGEGPGRGRLLRPEARAWGHGGSPDMQGAGGWMCGPSTKQDPRKTPLSVRGLLGTQGARLSPCRLQVGGGLGPGPRLGSRLKITTSVWSGTLWGRMSIGTDRRLQWDRQHETRTARHVGSKTNRENGRERRERSSGARTRPDTSEGTPLAPDGWTDGADVPGGPG